MQGTWRRALRRAATIVAGTTVLTVIGAGVALAAVSPSEVTASSTTLYWSGQGSPVNQLCGDSADPGADGYQNGATAGSYMLWIFATDGGSVTPPPTLTINNVTYGHAFKPGSSSVADFGFPGAWQIVTPYIDPGTITRGDGGSAYASFTVNSTGTGKWVLTISHGCAGTAAAQPLTASKTAAGDYTTTYKWDIHKAVDQTKINIAPDGTAKFNYTVTVHHDAGTDSNVGVSGDITVANPNGADVKLSGATDQLSDGTNCTVTGASGATVPANGDLKLPYTCPLNALPSGSLDNNATVSWDAQPLSDGSQLNAGSAPASAKGIQFTQHAVDDQVSVNDTLGGNLGTVSVGDTDPTTGSKDLTYSYTFSGDPAGTCTSHDNTATFTTNTTGTTDSASKTVQVCVGADLKVDKTATPSFDRTYTWGITKSVDKTKVNQVGGQATFNYTVNVTHDSGTPGNWQTAGNITVTNPNDWESVALTGVTDAIDNGGKCSVSGNTTATIAPKDSVTLPYTCTYSSAPSPSSFTNTATATWDPAAAFTAEGSKDGTAKGDFANANPNIIDGSVNVTDTLHGSLGTVSYTDPSPKALTYSNTVNVPQFNCITVNNTATFMTSDTKATGSDSRSVQVCGPAKTGALTMGYWQNKNGQAQITGGASTSGVCNSGTALRQYLPFQDLSATATCAQVATYVTNVIKAANASGSSMNAMLKAQMLATALDVYFNSSIGTTSIDLTQICKMIDGSGATATCSGTYENVSSAFGGATSLTVNQLLSYASGQSNSGGSVWYGQVKATQQLAKDTFDAINNQVAFGA